MKDKKLMLYQQFSVGYTDWKSIIDFKDLDVDINDFKKYMEKLGLEVKE